MRDAELLPGDRTSMRLFWECPDVAGAAQALAATGPGYLTMLHLDAEAFMTAARAAATSRSQEGLGVRVEELRRLKCHS